MKMSSPYFQYGEFECRKRERPATCPPCPACPKIPRCPPKPPVEIDINLLSYEVGFPEETLGQPTFEEEEAMNKPPSIGCFEIQINNEYEDEADQWFSKPPPVVDPIHGCTDPSATNYNPAATVDDGTCEYGPPPVPGCTDPSATNYNPAATVDDGSCVFDPPPVSEGFTPSHTLLSAPMSERDMINAATAFSNSDGRVRHQGVDGIIQNGATNIYDYEHPRYQWDGVPIDRIGKTNAELCAFVKPDGVWPSNFIYKGLLQRYREVQPFADEVNPTVEEIDMWNLEVINHFRNLLGVPGVMQPDARLYIECRLADERKYTTAWDASYPTGVGTDGPCPPGSAMHCGASFFPSQTDLAPYIAAAPYNSDFVKYPELDGYTTRRGQSEGIAPTFHWIPWGVKLAHILTQWICTEGLTGHPGPYFGDPPRATVGMSWWYNPPATGGSVFYRGKYR